MRPVGYKLEVKNINAELLTRFEPGNLFSY